MVSLMREQAAMIEMLKQEKAKSDHDKAATEAAMKLVVRSAEKERGLRRELQVQQSPVRSVFACTLPVSVTCVCVCVCVCPKAGW